MVPFTNPSLRIYALWASAVEQYLRGQHPDMPSHELRQLPMMQGVYRHVRAHEAGEVIPRADDFSQLSEAERMAYLSQTFLSFGLLAALSVTDYDTYNTVEGWIDTFDDLANVRPFSTDDLAGFALCLVLWTSLELNELRAPADWELKAIQKLFDYFANQLHLTQQQKDQVDQAIAELRSRFATLQYRSAPSSGYGAQRMDNDARVIMLGDWGTSLPDAAALLEAVWRETYSADPGREIVFVHLGDIYYAGLPAECEQNFHQVFQAVGAKLKSNDEFGSDFDDNPRIYTIPGNHEYYSFGYGYFPLIDTLNKERDTGQEYSFFCLRTEDGKWQFLGMDTGQDDYNALLTVLEALKGYIKKFIDEAIEATVPWPLDQWAEHWVKEGLERLLGPFEPQLRSQELTWHHNRIHECSAQTILCSHHQGFSNVAQINYKAPEFMNKGLLRSFQTYFKDSVAAWFWGHEHSYSIFEDGQFGLNKGRLLGSSSYEASEHADHPYRGVYPAVSLASDMRQADKTNGFYDHACAVFDLQRTDGGDSIQVTYYEYPSWGLGEDPPSDAKLRMLYSESISSKRADAPSSYWYGNSQIHSGHCETHFRPAMAQVADDVVLVWKDASESAIHWATCDLTSYDPVAKTWSGWTDRGAISARSSATDSSGTHLETGDAPAIALLGGRLILVFRDHDKDDDTGDYPLQWATFDATSKHWVKQGYLKLKPGGSQVYSHSGPALATFGDRMYLVYRNTLDSDKLYWASYQLPSTPSSEPGTWKDLGIITDKKGQTDSTNLPPSLAANANRMFLAYGQDDNNDIRWASYDGTVFDRDAGTFDTSQAGWALRGDVDVGDSDLETDKGLSIQADDSFVYMAFKAKNHSHIYWAAYDLEANQWNGNASLNSGQTSDAPALLRTGTAAIITARGDDNENIYWMFT